ncbi:MAG TPA: hypothetical protein GYA07_14020 [Verrucomicrobia bacterium]|nr:hypothetical protein [Verrucomicrobiota bacterium]
MKFLKQFLRLFSARRSEQEPEGTRPILPSSLLARYLIDRTHFSPQKGTVHASAFLPPKDLQLSVFHITGLPEADVWSIGEKFVAGPSKRSIRARADITAKSVSSPLSLDPDDDPPRHVSVVGWPKEKSEQKLIAAQLALLAKLSMKDRSG